MITTQLKIASDSLLRDLVKITKLRLAISVVFSSVSGYLLAVEDFSWQILLMLIIGGYAMVGASNAFNQIIERDLDALMDRTKGRPLPSGSMTVGTAFGIATLLTLIGISLLYAINPKTAFFGAVSIFIYTCLYTPLKTKTPLSVCVGAIPGAIPFMLGWVAATGTFGLEAGILFMMQFFWQFPHFWAIGWFLYEDYQKGGFNMLPTGKRNHVAAVQIILYTVWTIISSCIPALGITGDLYLSPVAALLILLIGFVFLKFAYRLFVDKNAKSAKHLMLASISYITLLQLVFVLDKYLRIWI